MKITKPEGIMTQGFAENANPFYKGVGLKGHTGEDYVIGYQKPIKAVVLGEVYSVRKARNKDSYQAVYQIVDDGEFSYEISYGHVDPFVKKGDVVKVGHLIGLESNWGECWTGGKRVTLDQKDSGRGSHLHFQVRKCIRVEKRDRTKTYLRDDRRYLQRDGFYYEVVDYDNGYNGCVDPEQFYEKKVSLQFIINLIKWLQKTGKITK